MSDLVTKLSQKAQTLLPEQRVRLAELLLDSIHPSDDSAVADAWDAELRKRIDEIDRGVAKLVPSDEVFAQIRRTIQ